MNLAQYLMSYLQKNAASLIEWGEEIKHAEAAAKAYLSLLVS